MGTKAKTAKSTSETQAGSRLTAAKAADRKKLIAELGEATYALLTAGSLPTPTVLRPIMERFHAGKQTAGKPSAGKQASGKSGSTHR